MTLYDDAETSCPVCTVGLDAAALCECPDEPMCVRCHRAYHVEHVEPGAQRRAPEEDDSGDELMRRAMSTWGNGDVA